MLVTSSIDEMILFMKLYDVEYCLTKPAMIDLFTVILSTWKAPFMVVPEYNGRMELVIYPEYNEQTHQSGLDTQGLYHCQTYIKAMYSRSLMAYVDGLRILKIDAIAKMYTLYLAAREKQICLRHLDYYSQAAYMEGSKTLEQTMAGLTLKQLRDPVR